MIVVRVWRSKYAIELGHTIQRRKQQRILARAPMITQRSGQVGPQRCEFLKGCGKVCKKRGLAVRIALDSGPAGHGVGQHVVGGQPDHAGHAVALILPRPLQHGLEVLVVKCKGVAKALVSQLHARNDSDTCRVLRIKRG